MKIPGTNHSEKEMRGNTSFKWQRTENRKPLKGTNYSVTWNNQSQQIKDILIYKLKKVKIIP